MDKVAANEILPDILWVIVSCDVSRSNFDFLKSYTLEKGIKEVILWTGQLIEAKLYSDYPDLLLVYFGYGIQSKRAANIKKLKAGLKMKQNADIKKLIGMLSDPAYLPVKNAIAHILDAQAYPWVDLVCIYRNRLIHRGYTLRPSFGFEKSNDLSIKIYKGNFAEQENFEIGKLFEQFITDLPKLEDQVCLALRNCVPELAGGPSVEIHYRSGGGATEYFEKDIKAI